MESSEALQYKIAKSDKDFKIGHKLFKEYVEGLDFSVYFQNFKEELKTIAVQYHKPHGCLILAFYEDVPMGCIGLRKFKHEIAELKRMYVKPLFRGKKIGLGLLELILKEAKAMGYAKIRLDSMRRMEGALKLYKGFGFYEIPAYRFNPLNDVVYLEKDLA